MFLAMGVGAYSAGTFHLLTHAAFKAALFMGSGSVIIAMHHEQDMRKMGGLLKKMPITGWAFIFATLAIMGFPGTSGFFSKDEILEKAFEESVWLWLVGFIVAGMTSFYMWRAVFMTFFGEFKGDHHTWEHCHEQPKRTVVPIAILAALALSLGFLNVPDFMGGDYSFSRYLSPVVKNLEEAQVHGMPDSIDGEQHAPVHAEEHGDLLIEVGLMVGSVTWTLLTAFLAYYLYLVNPKAREALMSRAGPQAVFKVLNNKYYVDEFYDLVVVGPLKKCYAFMGDFDKYVVDGAVNLAGYVGRGLGILAGFLDQHIVDGAVNEVAWASQTTGKGFSLLQSGRIQALVGATLVFFAAVLTVWIVYL